MICGGLAVLAVFPATGQLIFEAERYSSPAQAFTVNKLTPNAWNVWSTDRDAERKWSGGTVLQSPVVSADRSKPEDGAPALHTRITGIPAGRYEVVIKLGRALAVSRDGVAWEKTTSGKLGIIEITDGVFELWVDDRFVYESAPGSAYYDCLVFTPLPPKAVKLPVQGYATTRVVERLDRGLVLIEQGRQVYVSWRMLQDDAADLAFDLYRGDGVTEQKLNSSPIRNTSDWTDSTAPEQGNLRYRLQAVQNGGAGPAVTGNLVRKAASQTKRQYWSIPLQGNYDAQKVALADLDGDGRLDFVIKQPSTNIDPYKTYWTPSKSSYSLEAYRHDGSFMWKYDLGWSIEQGIWYSPYVVYDFDGDGKAEVAVKTGEGDPRSPGGKVEQGPEYVSMLDGQTGKLIAQTDWPSREGYSEYSFISRNQLGVAFLDGKTPCLLVERGTYSTIKLQAYEFSGAKFRELWSWSDQEDGLSYRGQGAHVLHAADVDADGRDEVIIGSAVIDDTGAGLWSTGLGHPDQVTVGDLVPDNPGMEIAYGLELAQTQNGLCMVDARTGRLLWGLQEPTKHVHSQGLCADLDAASPGWELYGGERDTPWKRWLVSAQGKVLLQSDLGGLNPRAAYWDADLQRELVTGKRIVDYPVVKSGTGGTGKLPGTELGSIEGTVIAVADIAGDWREEIITSLPGEIRVYQTVIPASDRRTTLWQDPVYRNGVAGVSQGYFQIPSLSRQL